MTPCDEFLVILHSKFQQREDANKITMYEFAARALDASISTQGFV